MSIVPRTVTVVDDDNDRSASLADFRSVPAYVLLGDPGAGKTTAFQEEAGSDPSSTVVTARRFIGRSLEHHPEWRAKTLFIDGLDEVRAGRPDARPPLDRILERLERLGNPRFRLSCRKADWLARTDPQEIVSLAGYEDLCILSLDPLGSTATEEIARDLGVPDIPDFLTEARRCGLEAMLDNPLLLGLLVKATRDNEWPGDRLGTLELACRKLVREWNDEHQAECSVPTERIMDAAGHLSALLLLSDRECVCPRESEAVDTLRPEDITDGDHPALLRALKTNLYVGRPDGCFVAAHRQLAEFLAARFLHSRITSEPGVPASRVLALITGEDGVVVTELRGLSAWLASFDKDSRRSLIATDPVGTALYGDVSTFQRDELERLLRALAERPDEIRAWSWPAIALVSLISHDTIGLLSQYLSDEDRTEGRQAVVGLLLHALSRAKEARPSRASLERAVRDATWQPWVRSLALRGLIYHSRTREPSTLIQLLDDCRAGKVEDDDRELQGALLTHVYPVHVGPARIWDYWQPPGLYSGDGEYAVFWDYRLLEKTKGSDVVPLLQALVERGAAFRARFVDDDLDDVVLCLVHRALRAVGDKTATTTICDWLEFMNFEESQSVGAGVGGYMKVSEWLADRPNLQKRLAREGMGRISSGSPRQAGEAPETADRSHLAWQVRESIFGAGVPDDFPEWCLHLAVDAVATRLDVAIELLNWSRPWHEGDSGTGLSIKDVKAATDGIPALRQKVGQLFQDQKKAQAARRFKEQESEYRRKQRREQAEFIAYVRENVSGLKAGTCSPRLLHHIAASYHGFSLRDRKSTPRLRVTKLLDGHNDLTDAAIAGFGRVNERDDLPTLREVIRLDEQGKISLLALPILAGLDSLRPESLDSRSPPEIARAAGLYYLTPLNVEGHPEWYRRALRYHSEPVAEALIKVTRSRVRRRQDCFHLWALARDKAHRAVARLAALPLLRAFPTRCTEPQVSALHEVLLAALKWEVEGLEAVVRQKVAKSDLDVSQRALWLAAGLLLSPEDYVPGVVEFVDGGAEARSRHIVRFLAPTQLTRLPMPWQSRDLKTMIRLLGSRYTPWRPDSFGMASIVDEDRTKVEALIAGWATTLASRIDRVACDALQALVDDSGLERWHILLKDKRDGQVLARRSATFTVPDLAAVQKTLANGESANSGDLAALVADKLEQLAMEISRGSTDEWRHFWNEKEYGRRESPKREESCCKALLSALRRLLPSRIDAQREAVYARDKRADIRVSFEDFGIPVEIKKDSHRRLWSAIADQLVPKYANAPESRGHGIYLVLWFGLGDMPVPPSGLRPKTPEALRERLEEQLTGPWSHKVKVIVIDVSGACSGGAGQHTHKVMSTDRAT